MPVAPDAAVNSAVALLFHYERNQTEPVDYQRFLEAVTGTPSFIGTDLTRDQAVTWARYIVSVVETAAAKPPVVRTEFEAELLSRLTTERFSYGTDNDGQIVIYTGLKEQDDKLVEFTEDNDHL